MGQTVLVVDDHADFRSVARTLLELDGFDVVGEAVDGATAIDFVRRMRPQVVLLDVQLPDLDGFEVAGVLADDRDGPAPEVVLVSTRSAHSYRRRLTTTTARGFVCKDELSGAAVRALLREG